jgi:5-amino-6-(5-phosphoribosylamino)uracil reductase
MSVDGHIDDAGERRLLLSNDADLDRVDEVRGGCDAILVGANTIRRDNPRLLIRSAGRRRQRRVRGLTENPAKVTLTNRGDLDPSANFFTAGNAEKIVYSAGAAVAATHDRLAGAATVVDAGDPVSLHMVLADLASRGMHRVMVEGGSTVHTEFLSAGLVDELHLVIAPFFVGDPAAARFAGDATFPRNAGHPMRLEEVRRIGDVVLLRYALTTRGRNADA